MNFATRLEMHIPEGIFSQNMSLTQFWKCATSDWLGPDSTHIIYKSTYIGCEE